MLYLKVRVKVRVKVRDEVRRATFLQTRDTNLLPLIPHP